MTTTLSQLEDGQAAIIFDKTLAVIRCNALLVMGGPDNVVSRQHSDFSKPEYQDLDFNCRLCNNTEALAIIQKYEGKDWYAIMLQELATKNVNNHPIIA